MTLSESNIKENKGKNTEYRPEVRDGDGEEGIEVLLLKFGDELAKRGDERRLLLEFMGGSEEGWGRRVTRSASPSRLCRTAIQRGCLVQCPLPPIRFQGRPWFDVGREERRGEEIIDQQRD